MTASLIVRPCVEEDWARAMALAAAVFVGEGFVAPERSEETRRLVAMEGAGTVLTAVDGREVLGVVVLANRGGPLALMAGEGEAEVRMLAVDPRARGRGVGEMLMRECIERAKGPPHLARAMVLSTQPGMKAAQRLYERMGFRRVPERDSVAPANAAGAAGSVTRERWAYWRALA